MGDRRSYGSMRRNTGVTESVDGDRIEQRWDREKLERQLDGDYSPEGNLETQLDYSLEDLQRLVTTGGGMHGPQWFDRCPDNWSPAHNRLASCAGGA